MKLNAGSSKLVPLVVYIFLFFLSSYQRISVLCIGAMVLLWLLNPALKMNVIRVFKDKVLVLFLIFYLLHVISLLYTSNFKYASFDLEVKLSFIVFPFVLPAFSFSPLEINRAKRVFIAGVSFAAMLCLVNSILKYRQSHNIDSFFYTRYSYTLHPAYFTMYFNLALLFVLDIFFVQVQKNKGSRWLLFLLMIFLFANLTLLSSRTASVVSVATIVVYLFYLFFRKKTQGSGNKVFAASFLILMALTQVASVDLNNRFKQVEETVKSDSFTTAIPPQTSSTETPSYNSTSIHILVWEYALELIRQHPFLGVGVGDVHDELKKVYAKNNFQYGVEHEPSPHNQFLQTTAALGIVGFTVLMLIFVVPLIFFIKKDEWVYALFMLMVMLNCLTESMLERQAGIIFFTFFAVFFYLQSKQRTVTN